MTRDVARARPDEGVADHQAAPHVPLGIGEAMGGAVGAEQARLRQGAGIAPVGLDLAGAGRIHGREVRVGDDDLVAEGLETAGHPFAVGRGLDHNPGAGPGPEHGGEALGLGADALLDHLTPLGEDVDLAFPLVHVDANMVHGWPLPLCGVDREVLLWGSCMPPRQARGQPLHPSILTPHTIPCSSPSARDRLRPGLQPRAPAGVPLWVAAHRARPSAPSANRHHSQCREELLVSKQSSTNVLPATRPWTSHCESRPEHHSVRLGHSLLRVFYALTSFHTP